MSKKAPKELKKSLRALLPSETGKAVITKVELGILGDFIEPEKLKSQFPPKRSEQHFSAGELQDHRASQDCLNVTFETDSGEKSSQVITMKLTPKGEVILHGRSNMLKFHRKYSQLPEPNMPIEYERNKDGFPRIIY